MMRRSIALSLLLFLSLPAFGARRVTVKQLEKVLPEASSKPDLEVARMLFGLELTERVPPELLKQWKEEMPGKSSVQALTAIADLSAFLNLPPDEVPKTPPPDANAQRALLDLAATYVENTLLKLPNFFATQAITTFEDTPASQEGMNYYASRPIHFASSKGAVVYYRDGKEVMETRKGQQVLEDGQTVTYSSGLLSSGEFGPVLRTVLSDARSGKLNWSRWESVSTTSQAAVFSYSVPHSRSHYRTRLELPGDASPFQLRPGYHGEISLDPATGTILRLTLKAELNDNDPLSLANLMVEYGPVEIGGRSYICPVRSVAVVHVLGEMRMVGRPDAYNRAQAPANDQPVQTILNDVAFTHYQVLRTEAKILSGADTDDAGDVPK